MAKEVDFTVFRSRFKALSEEHGLTFRELSKAIGFSPSALSRYLAGSRNPDLRSIVYIANYFHVSIDWLLGLEDIASPNKLPQEAKDISTRYLNASPTERAMVRAVLYRDYDQSK